MMQCGFKQMFFTKAYFEIKNIWAYGREISYKKQGVFFIDSCFLCKCRKWEKKIKALNILTIEKDFIHLSAYLSQQTCDR